MIMPGTEIQVLVATKPVDFRNWTERLRRRWCSLLVTGRTEPVE